MVLTLSMVFGFYLCVNRIISLLIYLLICMILKGSYRHCNPLASFRLPCPLLLVQLFQEGDLGFFL